MTHGSLFSGIGGFDLAAQWMGWENIFHVENDPFCRKVLAHHFPKSESYNDVKTFDATKFRGRLSILSGGFPCQPFSAAGKRAGTSDDRYLWPEMFRIIREARPTYVVAENVRGLLSWNEGLVLDTVCSDLESEGYEVFPVVLGAASVNAPHRRDRIWIVAAHAERLRLERGRNRTNGIRTKACNGSPKVYSVDRDATNAHNELRNEWDSQGTAKRPTEPQKSAQPPCSSGNEQGDAADPSGRRRTQDDQQHPAEESQLSGTRWERFPIVAPVCRGDDGLSSRLDGISFPKWRRESIKAYGNAIVPQVAYQIFKAL
jgi:DNA (cytosine-5)-methyltransferase 1